MKKQIEKLMAIFDLENEVEKFVKNRVAEIVEDKHEFHFVGTNLSNATEEAAWEEDWLWVNRPERELV